MLMAYCFRTRLSATSIYLFINTALHCWEYPAVWGIKKSLPDALAPGWLGTTLHCLNSLAPGKFEWNFRYIIFKRISVTDGWGISCEINLIWMSLSITDDQSILVQVMAWCRQATSHYLSQCWPRSLSPYGVTRPQWVNILKTRSLWHSI